MNNVINLTVSSNDNVPQVGRRRSRAQVINISNNEEPPPRRSRTAAQAAAGPRMIKQAPGPRKQPARGGQWRTTGLRVPRSPPPPARPPPRAPTRGARVVPHRPAELPANRNFNLNAQVAANAANNGQLITQFRGFQLQPHQIAVSQLFIKPATPGLLLYFKVGSGKTLASIAAVENLARAENIRRKVLVVGPASLEANYMNELRSAGVNPDRYEFMSFQKLHYDANKIRISMKRRNPNVDDEVVRKKMNEYLNTVGQYVYRRTNGVEYRRGKVLVVDEVQNVKNTLGELLTSLLEVSRTAHKRLLLTGTPVVNYPSDMGAYLGLIEPRNDELVVKVMKKGVYVPAFEVNFGRTAGVRIPELDALLKCTTLFYEPSAEIQRMHYPTKTEQWVEVPLTVQQMRRHFEIAAEQGTRRDMENINIHNSALEDQKSARMFINAARQINNIWGVYHPKIDAVVAAIIAEVRNNGKCIFYDFFKDSWKTVRDMLLRREPALIKLASFTGETPDRERISIVNDYNTDKLNVLLLSSAGGEGLDLKNTTQMHILQPWWNEEKINQVIGRAVRYKSHTRGRRHVDVFRYCAVFPPGGDTMKDKYIPAGFRSTDLGFAYEYTADEVLRNISVRKAQDNRRFLTRLVRISDENLRTCM